jgi:hypothetical protein
MYRAILTVAVAPLARGDYSYSYDAPTMAPTTNQPIGSWSVNKVTNMYEMFKGASSFNQTLGWCVANSVTVTDMFASYLSYNAPPCGPTCGVTFDCPGPP